VRSNKHHTYHRTPRRFETEISGEGRRYRDEDRFSYISSRVTIKGKRILDIGCNTGFFMFECLDQGAEFIVGYEGSALCWERLQQYAANSEGKVSLQLRYYDFETIPSPFQGKFDVALNLNVMHHLGDDFGTTSISKREAKIKMIEGINSLSRVAKVLVLQLGFNWKSDTKECLFDNGTKSEMIDFVTTGVDGYWRVKHVGVAESEHGEIAYKDVNSSNVARLDELGEFLNRPIFILESLF